MTENAAFFIKNSTAGHVRFLARGPLKDIRWSMYIGGVLPSSHAGLSNIPVLKWSCHVCVLVWRSQCGNAGVFRDQPDRNPGQDPH